MLSETEETKLKEQIRNKDFSGVHKLISDGDFKQISRETRELYLIESGQKRNPERNLSPRQWKRIFAKEDEAAGLPVKGKGRPPLGSFVDDPKATHCGSENHRLYYEYEDLRTTGMTNKDSILKLTEDWYIRKPGVPPEQRYKSVEAIITLMRKEVQKVEAILLARKLARENEETPE